MVEFTLQIVLQIVQTIALIVGIVYYITIMRNAQKARRYENLQWFLNDRTNEDVMLQYTFVSNLEWEDYDDFERRYGIKTNPDAWARIYSYLVRFDDIGLILKKGHIDIDILYEFTGRMIQSLWKKYQPIIEERRRRVDPTHFNWFQYLVEEMNKESKRRGDKLLPELT